MTIHYYTGNGIPQITLPARRFTDRKTLLDMLHAFEGGSPSGAMLAIRAAALGREADQVADELLDTYPAFEVLPDGDTGEYGLWALDRAGRIQLARLRC